MRRFDPNKHHRRSIRLRGYDYSRAGAYFVTIVTQERECLFDDVSLRRVIETYWRDIPRHFVNVSLDEWVVMPNHLHGIVVIEDGARRGEAFSRSRFDDPSNRSNGLASSGVDDLENASLPLTQNATSTKISDFSRLFPGAAAFARAFCRLCGCDQGN